MRIIIEVSDPQSMSSGADVHPTISVGTNAHLETRGETAQSGGVAPAYGGVIGFMSAGEVPDALSGGAAEAPNASSAEMNTNMDLNGGAAP